MKCAFLSLCAISALFAPAFAAATWSVDLPAALEQSVKEKRAVLLRFTGSDWCAPCQMLEKAVLSTPAFEDYAKARFLLVDVDLPNGSIISPEQKAKNKAVAEDYRMTSFPTLLVLTPDGIVLGGWCGGASDVSVVTQALDEALALAPTMHAALTKALSLKGQAKAEALMEAYQLVASEFQEHNVAMKAQIRTLDRDDAFGFAAAEKRVEDERAAYLFAKNLEQELNKEHLMRLEKEMQRKTKSKYYRVALAWAKFNILLEQCYDFESDADIIKALTALKSSMQGVARLDPEAKALMDEAVDEALADFSQAAPPDLHDGEGEASE